MSDASKRGRDFENKVRKIMSRKLKLEIKRDKQSGAGIHKQDIRDRYDQLPLFIECKDHKTIKPKEWWREADGKSSHGQAAVVVMPDNEEVLCVMRFEDLLNIVRESMDWQEAHDFLRMPSPKLKADPVTEAEKATQELINQKLQNDYVKQCRDGHIADRFGYCSIKDCKYSRGYRPKKPKR